MTTATQARQMTSHAAKTIRPLPASQLTHLRPRNMMGILFTAGCAGLTALSLRLSASGHPAVWLAGQLLLTVALIQWFILLHEAGHQTLFRTRLFNTCVGHLASFFAVIPFEGWKRVHHKHHVWTGWQDLDLTTATLVPRPLGRIEKLLVNGCWKYWIPLFSIIYRANNFWNLTRLGKFFPSGRQRTMGWNILLLLAVYTGVMFWIGFGHLVHLAGLGVLLYLAFQDPLLLSQHTHVPQQLSRGEKVQPYAARQQEQFTRSLIFPRWFSACVLMHFDAHELHHMYVQVPGYDLGRIDYAPLNAVHWWQWLTRAKRLSGETFLFQNRTQSGVDL